MLRYPASTIWSVVSTLVLALRPSILITASSCIIAIFAGFSVYSQVFILATQMERLTTLFGYLFAGDGAVLRALAGFGV